MEYFGERLVFSFLENYRYASPHLRTIGLFGVIGEPLFYLIWSVNDPEGFESLPLRLIAAALCGPIVFSTAIERKLGETWIAIYFAMAATYCLPFFFGYVLLMNAQDAATLGSVSIHWPMQHLVALLLLVLVLPVGAIAALAFCIGTMGAWALFLITHPDPNPTDEVIQMMWQLMPIYAFILAAGSVFNRNREMINREKIRTVAAVGSTIAHELRTPFLGIRALAESIRNYLPSLLQTYDLAVRLGLKVDPIRRSHVEGLKLSLDRISDEIDYSNRVVDMLLINSSEAPVRGAQFVTFSASGCVTEAVARFPFNNDQEVSLVNVDVDDDFNISAPRLLIVHVFFNLLKNSLYYVQKAGRGSITIRLEARPDLNRIVFEDTGTGVPPQIIDRIFERFFTTTESGYGAGIGLSFCRLVMQGVGGSIRCDSEFGSYTRFTLEFPNVRDG